MAIIYLIRHGQGSFKSNDYDQLSALGFQQSALLGKTMKTRGIEPFRSVSGTMKRQTETAETFLSHFTDKPIEHSNKRWNEYDHEALLKSQLGKIGNHNSIKDYVMAQDQPMRAFQDLLNQAIEAWMTGKADHPTSWKAYQKASWEALNEMAEKLKKGENGIVFTSGGPISSIVIQLLDLPEEKFMYLQNRIVNTSITKVLIGKSGLSLSTFNDYGHLEHDRKLLTYR